MSPWGCPQGAWGLVHQPRAMSLWTLPPGTSSSRETGVTSSGQSHGVSVLGCEQAMGPVGGKGQQGGWRQIDCVGNGRREGVDLHSQAGGRQQVCAMGGEASGCSVERDGRGARVRAAMGSCSEVPTVACRWQTWGDLGGGAQCIAPGGVGGGAGEQGPRFPS